MRTPSSLAKLAAAAPRDSGPYWARLAAILARSSSLAAQPHLCRAAWRVIPQARPISPQLKPPSSTSLSTVVRMISCSWRSTWTTAAQGVRMHTLPLTVVVKG